LTGKCRVGAAVQGWKSGQATLKTAFSQLLEKMEGLSAKKLALGQALAIVFALYFVNFLLFSRFFGRTVDIFFQFG